jgi:uncharacterized protein (DUF1684 family)
MVIRRITSGNALMAFGLAILLLAMPGCGRRNESPAVSEPEVRRNVPKKAASSVERDRQEKDLAYKVDPGSPIPERDRANFHGLAYFPPDPAFRFKVKLNRYPRPEAIRMRTNTGEMRNALRYGYFDFQVGGQACRLQVYRTEDSQTGGKPYLFVPFRDVTSGKETYGGGRYLDFQENTSGFYDLDFNRAYNPFCAYGGDYSCPVPPEENRLLVAILAGERTYPLEK